MTKFEGSSSISSDDYFGRSTSKGGLYCVTKLTISNGQYMDSTVKYFNKCLSIYKSVGLFHIMYLVYKIVKKWIEFFCKFQ